ncbi:VOC family protein [Pseudoalteromonas haloplanktis]|uniref:VOC family protein n=1 Tax=Pseudoalteromonas haloplanktis TaxID=228 RepID=A0ABU1BHG1_PSEHA|nr:MULTISPECIES: VOC family protein [Pseudoalteromonas]MDQ9093677.1 VOC family protein [Pseudoalteromonas haloplanktis]BDF95490.1 glyoxalase [Pseudoalteromonas sp. KAN5]
MLSNSKIGAICYYISDLDKTEAFYRDTLGIDIQRMEDEGEGWLLAKTVNAVELLFFKQESRPGNSPIIVFELADGGIDDVIEALAEKGTTIVTPVSHAPGGWSAEIADPDNHQISMYQSDEVPRSRK